MNTIGAIILAAGKGSRMKANGINKVVLPVGKKPLILHGIHLLEKLQIKPIIVVVGFEKESIIRVIDREVIFAEQKEQLGTADAVASGLKKLPAEIQDVLVLYGDDF